MRPLSIVGSKPAKPAAQWPNVWDAWVHQNSTSKAVVAISANGVRFALHTIGITKPWEWIEGACYGFKIKKSY